MTLNDFILYFGQFAKKFSPRKTRHESLCQEAEGLYIGLGLDMKNVGDIRSKVVEESETLGLEEWGKNIPELFEKHLSQKLDEETLPENFQPEQFEKMFLLLIDATRSFIDSQHHERNTEKPFCLGGYNYPNQSAPEENQEFCRYMALDSFERRMCFGETFSPPRNRLENRRNFYSPEQKENYRQRLFDYSQNPERAARVFLGPAIKNFGQERELPTVTFFTPSEEAPHRQDQKITANQISARMGIPDWLNEENQIRSQGVAALNFLPEEEDSFYQPTAIDALGNHKAFRPAPFHGEEEKTFRHGWTRICATGDSPGQLPRMTEEKGQKEVILPSRSENFPSENLTLENIYFFE